MIYRRHAPRPPLSEFVELLWFFESAAPSHQSERVLPTGTVELVINLRDTTERSLDAVVAGPHSRFFVLDTGRPSSVIGVHFKPGGAYPFFALPMDELRNRLVSLEALCGRDATLLRRPHSHLASIGQALACGYCDQSHINHDLQEFAGLSLVS
jgi:hypothetical protein